MDRWELAQARSSAQLASLDRLVRRSAEGSFGIAPPGKWSAREHLAHLARHLEVFLDRLELILSYEAPALSRYRAEEDPEWPEWRSLPAEELFNRLARSKQRLHDRLASLDERAFARIGAHPAYGEMTLAEWLDFQLDHEAHHLYRMRALLSETG